MLFCMLQTLKIYVSADLVEPFCCVGFEQFKFGVSVVVNLSYLLSISYFEVFHYVHVHILDVSSFTSSRFSRFVTYRTACNT